MTFNDVFKSSFLDSFSSFSLLDTALSLGAAFVIGLFIFYVYQKTYSGVLYSRSFNVSLVAILLVTTLVISGVTSNVVLSLGMVGALSIVRFRTAVKDPMDLVFLFWAIAEGILCGASLLPLALLGCPILGIFLLVFCAPDGGSGRGKGGRLHQGRGKENAAQIQNCDRRGRLGGYL